LKSSASAIKRLESNPRDPKNTWFERQLETRPLATNEIDAVTAALTAGLHLKSQTERIDDHEEGYIIVPKKRHWRNLI